MKTKILLAAVAVVFSFTVMSCGNKKATGSEAVTDTCCAAKTEQVCDSTKACCKSDSTACDTTKCKKACDKKKPCDKKKACDKK